LISVPCHIRTGLFSGGSDPFFERVTLNEIKVDEALMKEVSNAQGISAEHGPWMQ